MVVLDTNVIISAFLWRGRAKEIFKLAEGNQISICISREIIDELQRVLSYPKFHSQLLTIGKTPREIVDEFLEIAEYYPGENFPTSEIVSDPSDNKFLACALAARADFIVSGDRHLLSLKQFQDIPILSPKQFLKRLK